MAGTIRVGENVSRRRDRCPLFRSFTCSLIRSSGSYLRSCLSSLVSSFVPTEKEESPVEGRKNLAECDQCARRTRSLLSCLFTFLPQIYCSPVPEYPSSFLYFKLHSSSIPRFFRPLPTFFLSFRFLPFFFHISSLFSLFLSFLHFFFNSNFFCHSHVRQHCEGAARAASVTRVLHSPTSIIKGKLLPPHFI